MQFKSLQNNNIHRLDVFHHLVIPKPQYFIALLLKPIGASCIVSLLTRVLASIYLDDQAPFEASKIDNIPADRVLPTEPVPIHLAIAKVRPQAPFSF